MELNETYGEAALRHFEENKAEIGLIAQAAWREMTGGVDMRPIDAALAFLASHKMPVTSLAGGAFVLGFYLGVMAEKDVASAKALEDLVLSKEGS